MNADALSNAAEQVRTPRRTQARTALPKLLDPARAWSLPAVFGHSLFPWVALALIAGTAFWGPWISLLLTFAWWRCVTWFG